MICYLPFTHVTANPFEPLAQALGPLTVYTPCTSLVSESIRQWQQQGLMELRTPSGLDEGKVLNLLQEFKNWATLHDGHIGDMIHFFNTNKGRPPMVDEMAPSQISTRVRHFGEDAANNETGMLVQAALYLALAQEYDQHQERLCSDLKAVKGMEQAMFATMGSSPDGSEPLEDKDLGIGDGPCPEDAGAYMTERRLQAWARIGLSDALQSWAYVTPSYAVFEHLKGLAPETVNLQSWYLSRQVDHPDLKQQRRMALKKLSDATNFKKVELDPNLCGQPADDALTLEWIGCTGFLFETLWPGQFAPEARNNTLLGLVKSAR